MDRFTDKGLVVMQIRNYSDFSHGEFCPSDINLTL
jgi:hypothetical protein